MSSGYERYISKVIIIIIIIIIINILSQGCHQDFKLPGKYNK